MVLGIQFRTKPEAIEQERECIVRQTGLADMCWLNACDESVSWEKPSELLAGVEGVILGGSGEFDFDGGRDETDTARAMSLVFLERLTPLFDHIFAYDVPTFGICYGHQVIGAYAGVRVWNDHTQKKTGTYTVEPTPACADDVVCSFVQEPVMAQFGHKDALHDVPPGATLLLCSEQCRVSALRYQQHIYTTQFHPELTAADMIKRLNATPDYLPEGVAAEDIIKDDPRANALLRNFIDKVVAPSV